MLIFLWPIKISAIAYVGANMVLPEIQYSELVYPFKKNNMFQFSCLTNCQVNILKLSLHCS